MKIAVVGSGTATDSVDTAQSPLSNSLILPPHPADLTSNVGALPIPHRFATLRA